MKRKYAPPIQHSIYKDGWKDALHAVGDLVEKKVTRFVDENESPFVYVEDLEVELGKLAEGLK